MLAIQAPPATALITPARRDSPRPTAIVRSASGPRPKTSRLPSGIPSTSPDGVVTRAAAGLLGWDAIAAEFTTCHHTMCTAGRSGSASLGPVSAPVRSRNPGMVSFPFARLAREQPGAGHGYGPAGKPPVTVAGPDRVAGQGAGQE